MCFWKKILRLPKGVYRNGKLHFWQSRLNCFAKSPKMFAGCPETIKDGFVWIEIILQNVPPLRRNQFWQPCQIFSTKTPSFFAESPKWKKSFSFFKENAFIFKYFLWAGRMPFWQLFQKTGRPDVNYFSAESDEILKK